MSSRQTPTEPATVRVVVADLLDRVARLEERANKTSRTVVQARSSDPPSASSPSPAVAASSPSPAVAASSPSPPADPSY